LSYLHGGRTLSSGVGTEVLGSAAAVGTGATRAAVRRHTSLQKVWWGRRGAVRRADAGVVLRPAPREADAGVADGITLHLVDRHLSGVPMHELNKATALSRGNLDVGDFSESLEEGAELILGHVATQATHEDSGVVGIRELVHGLHRSVGRRLLIVKGHGSAPAHGAGSSGTSNLGNHLTGRSGMTGTAVLVVRPDMG
jgi:hypothetical protein